MVEALVIGIVASIIAYAIVAAVKRTTKPLDPSRAARPSIPVRKDTQADGEYLSRLAKRLDIVELSEQISRVQEEGASFEEIGKRFKGQVNKLITWYEAGAEHGVAHFQYRLGVAYKQGFGVQEDWDMARYWFARAAEQGHPEASVEFERVSSKWGRAKRAMHNTVNTLVNIGSYTTNNDEPKQSG